MLKLVSNVAGCHGDRGPGHSNDRGNLQRAIGKRALMAIVGALNSLGWSLDNLNWTSVWSWMVSRTALAGVLDGPG